MKRLIKFILGFINKFQLWMLNRNISIASNSFFRVRIAIERYNKVNLKKTRVEKVRITVSGRLNEINANNALISNSLININGSNNKITLDSDVKLRSAIIHIRGNNCSINIGQGTTFGGVRMVDVGNNNSIKIGQNCLFADHIEIWSSDTHTILNANHEMINPEKPVIIGDRVWVGSHAIILKGVTINNDAVIGMGTIVTNNVPKKSINVGTPNRTIKENITWKLDY